MGTVSMIDLSEDKLNIYVLLSDMMLVEARKVTLILHGGRTAVGLVSQCGAATTYFASINVNSARLGTSRRA